MVDRALMAAMIAQFIPGMIVTYINGGTQALPEKGNPGKLKVKHPEKGGGVSAAGGGGEGQHRSSKRISLVTGAGLKTARFGCIVKGPFYSKTTSIASNSASSTTAVTVKAAGLGAALISSSLSVHDNTPSITDEMVMTLMIGLGDEVSSYCCCC